MKTKRFLSVLLTLVMVVGLLSGFTMTANAEETTTTVEAIWGVSENDLTAGSGTLAEAITAASAENSTVKYIRLVKDIEATSNYGIPGGEFTLDLNGKKLDYFGKANYPTLLIKNSGTKITLEDSTNSVGRVTQDSDSTITTNAIHVEAGAEVIINSGNYKGIAAAGVKSNGTLTINGGNFETKTVSPVHCSGGTLIINNGKFSGGTRSAVHFGSGTFTINGGTFINGTNGTFSYFNGKLTITEFENLSGITVYVNNHNAPLEVSSDRFVLPEGYALCSGDTVVTEVEYESKYTIKEMPACNITIENPENGTITADKEKAKYGEEITLTATPESGYKLMTITVTDKNGKPVVVTNDKFIMPEMEVTVTAVFVPETEEYFVILNPMGGLCDVKEIKLNSGGTLSQALPEPIPVDTIYEGYWFKGWYDAPTGGNEVTAETTFAGGATIYAQWDIVKTEITKYSPDFDKVYFTCGKSDVNAIVIFVDYANYDDPTFVSLKYVPVTTQKTQGENTVSVTVPSDINLFAGDKIMIWENFETLKPLCEAYRVSSRETDVEDNNPGIDLPIDWD